MSKQTVGRLARKLRKANPAMRKDYSGYLDSVREATVTMRVLGLGVPRGAAYDAVYRPAPIPAHGWIGGVHSPENMDYALS